jgi:hypothetical protein
MNKRGYFILFGWGHTTRKDYGSTIPIKCTNCNNEVYYQYIKIKNWFTLFFIPIFPIEVNHYLLCPICQVGWKLNDDGIELAKELNQLTTKFNSKEITSNKYYNKGNKLYVKLIQEGIIIEEK